MAACRTLDVLLGAGPDVRAAAPMALAVGAHTYGISVLGRAEVTGAAPETAGRALTATATAATLASLACLRGGTPGRAAASALIAAYLTTSGRAQAALRVDPAPDRVRQAVRMSILGLIPLQAAAVAGRGRLAEAGALLGALPLGRWLSARMATS
ncbi:hypothetical protein GCM10010517_78130 [Streptosporangium fragile]|uniref:Prenyltransferase n=1 Tax=Streptosporangium fragile TaxID=46186 RepID=A0ABN3WDN9_9ACTN